MHQQYLDEVARPHQQPSPASREAQLERRVQRQDQ